MDFWEKKNFEIAPNQRYRVCFNSKIEGVDVKQEKSGFNLNRGNIIQKFSVE